MTSKEQDAPNEVQNRIQKCIQYQLQTLPSRLQSDQQRVRNEALISFLCSNGLSLDCVEEEAFIEFFKIFGHRVPKKLELHNTMILQPKINVEFWKKSSDPVAISYDVKMIEDDAFLVYSITGYDEDVRTTQVFMKKLYRCEAMDTNIHNLIIRANKIDVNKYNYLVTPVQRLSPFRSFICFHSYLSQFANTILSIPIFQERLKILKNFVKILKTNATMNVKFNRLTERKKEDLPVWKSENWLDVWQFLKESIRLHYIFRGFSRDDIYLSMDMHRKIVLFFEILSTLRKCAEELSSEKSCVSRIVPVVVSLEKYVDTLSETLPDLMMAKIYRSFRQNLSHIITRESNKNHYHFACLLDIRYGYSTQIFETTKWTIIEREFVQYLMLSQVDVEKWKEERIQVQNELQIYRLAAASFQKNERFSHVDISFWWKEHQNIFPKLFIKSKIFLVAPAVSIDSQYYFAKYSRMLETNIKSSRELQDSLGIAAKNEEFHGRGENLNEDFEEEDDPLRRLIEYNQTLSERPAREEIRIEDFLMEEPPEKVIKIEEEEEEKVPI